MLSVCGLCLSFPILRLREACGCVEKIPSCNYIGGFWKGRRPVAVIGYLCATVVLEDIGLESLLRDIEIHIEFPVDGVGRWRWAMVPK